MIGGKHNLLSNIRDAVYELKEEYGACSLKLGTEAEANTFEDIAYMQENVGDIIPIIVKVGGCEARNDIRKMAKIGVSGIVGPMIESPYSLKIFVNTMKLYYGELDNVNTIINIESITGFENLGRIINSPFFESVDQITIGRSDFSGSIGIEADHPKVYEFVREIVNAAHKAGKITSVGGGITPLNAIKIKEYTKTEKINIRTAVVDLRKCKDIFEAIKKSLELEILILENNKLLFPEYTDYYINRIKVIKERIAC
ncbi:MAG: aldolase/citrate lyase family protein [Candidatus Muirbacterium halophilum]|nr:aldolase/citrate lyase family protein [Candidatus Muirbacterium halophilum]MCK9475816.1 aldolase/citrate lyase family protein [Candidatus Muirbacterium halophilum]